MFTGPDHLSAFHPRIDVFVRVQKKVTSGFSVPGLQIKHGMKVFLPRHRRQTSPKINQSIIESRGCLYVAWYWPLSRANIGH
jgi:hypothetical protein